MYRSIDKSKSCQKTCCWHPFFFLPLCMYCQGWIDISAFWPIYDLFQDFRVDIVDVLLTTAISTWWHPSLHFISKNWIFCSGPSTLLVFVTFTQDADMFCVLYHQNTLYQYLPTKDLLSTSHQQVTCRYFLGSRASVNVAVAPGQKYHNKKCTHPHLSLRFYCWADIV